MLSSLFKDKSESPIRLVAALNGVDKIGPGNWDERLNAPSREQEASIRRRCKDIAAKLSSTTGLDADQIEYYSALKRDRLIDLLSAAIRAATAGFKLDALQPRDPFELADPEVRAFAEQERARRAAARKGSATRWTTCRSTWRSRCRPIRPRSSRPRSVPSSPARRRSRSSARPVSARRRPSITCSTLSGRPATPSSERTRPRPRSSACRPAARLRPSICQGTGGASRTMRNTRPSTARCCPTATWSCWCSKRTRGTCPTTRR